MKTRPAGRLALLVGVLLANGTAHAQVLIQGRLFATDTFDRTETFTLSTVLATAALPGTGSEPSSFRTWETHPAGWFRLSGGAGRYTIALSQPAHFMRPRILTNQFLRDGDSLDLRPGATFDFACFHDKSWDPKPARRYWQPFFARGTSVTAVGFKLATDGVDGGGPGKQDVLLSIHRRTRADPREWPQVGPTATVVSVDCGGPKSYWFSAGWQSGEVPTEPGAEYAVSIRPKSPEGTFQAFWRPRTGGSSGVYREGLERRGFEARDIWLAVSSDGEGLLISYAKRVHYKYHELTALEKKWSQVWRAQGRGLASVVLYAAVSGKQPPLSRQRVRVRVRAGGPTGKVIGTEKIGVGNGNYTGDASWGHFVAVFEPGEVPLEPGRTYAIEFESIETPRTVGDFVNIKGQKSDGRAGFNPYRKCPPDDYPHGTAYRRGTEAQDFDLDLQIVEYEHARTDWHNAVAGRDLLVNGSMEARKDGTGDADAPPAWEPFRLAEGTHQLWATDEGHAGSFLRISSADAQHAIDGGWVQRVSRLAPTETYRLTGRVRSTWPATVDRNCAIGVDPSGQTDDPRARTIEWTLLPGRHGEFVDFTSRPVRPGRHTVSVWLRARCAKEDPRFPFRADFDDFSLRRVDSSVPLPGTRVARAGFIDRVPPEREGATAPRLELVRKRRKHTPVLVHRGASRFAPENTIEAFSAALDRGADGFEMDIRRSRDGVLYVFHDDTLDRMTQWSGAVRGRSYFELLGCNVGDGAHRIPTLAAVFTLARDRAALLHLDVKESGLEEEILRLIDAADLWEHVVEVNSGNAASVRGHDRIRLLRYKGWFPQDPSAAGKLADRQKRFLDQPGDMIFTKGDPIDAVHALGREPGPPEVHPRLESGYLGRTWEPE